MASGAHNVQVGLRFYLVHVAARLRIVLIIGWLGSRVVSVLDSGAEGPGFKSHRRRSRATVLGKLFTPIVPVFTKQQIGSSPLKGCEGNCRPGKK